MSTPYIGEIRLFGFARVPSGWLSCDGALLSIAEYETLYTLIGTTYGGDGQNTFAVPDLRGQLPLHNGNGPGLTPRVIGETGGSENVSLLPTQLPAHSHTYLATSTLATATSPAGAQLAALSGDTMYATDISGVAAVPLAATAIGAAGGSLPHENTMPTLTVQFCIASNGIFPSQQ